MPVGFGAEPTINPTTKLVTSGTTDTDLRKIWGGLYPQPGLVSGGLVSQHSSAMSYAVTAGVAVIRMANGEHVLAPIPATTVSPTPTGAARTDIIYVQQNIPSVEGNSDVVVKVGPSLPAARAVELARFSQTATATNTASGVRTGQVNYSIPYGASLGTLWRLQDTYSGLFTARTTMGTGSFYLPTDRQVRATMTTVVVANGASGFDNSKYCESSYNLVIDGQTKAVWRSPGLHQAWQWIQFDSLLNISAGTHTISVDRGREVGPGTPHQVYGYNMAPGCIVELRDEGVAV